MVFLRTDRDQFPDLHSFVYVNGISHWDTPEQAVKEIWRFYQKFPQYQGLTQDELQQSLVQGDAFTPGDLKLVLDKKLFRSYNEFIDWVSGCKENNSWLAPITTENASKCRDLGLLKMALSQRMRG